MMNVCEQLASDLGSLFVCEPLGSAVRVRTPYLYPDGDVIDVFYKGDATGAGTVSDVGETVRWLRSQTIAPRRSPKQNAMLHDAAATLGVEFFRGMLQARVGTAADLAEVITRVSQAALRVSDLWFTFRTRAAESVTDEIADFLAESKIKFERSPKLPGRSRRIWTPSFHTHTTDISSLVYVLSTGNRSAARNISHMVHTAWYDLSHLEVGPQPMKFVSLFDDTLDVWSDEDFSLLKELSTVALWSDPRRFREELTAA